jgi:hypothetical protein
MTTYKLKLTPQDAPHREVSGLSRSEAMTALINLMYPMPVLDAEPSNVERLTHWDGHSEALAA